MTGRPGPADGKNRGTQPGDGQRRVRIPVARGPAPKHRLPGLLAALCDRLPEDRLDEWEQTLARASGPEDPLLVRFTASQPAAGTAERMKAVLQVWRAELPDLSGTGLALALAAVRAAPRPLPAQPVISGPVSAATPARLTSGVALEVIRCASASLLIATYAAHGASDVVEEIAAAAGRGVQVDLLLEETTHAATAFSDLTPDVRIWHRTGSAGVLHAKAITADRHTALLGSANLTDRGLTENVELGVILRDPGVVGPLVDHFRWLIAPQTGLMRRCP
ncbi:DISARM system phospholipase D-like protein DrmC [Streptomyces sp. NPDC005897]|uniref:DISARM system phospholipase D-like protein DrmC n=1 Tax=Streptomyces sp. NPDC005897 TaxID=3157081 RepID=UPI003406E92B